MANSGYSRKGDETIIVANRDVMYKEIIPLEDIKSVRVGDIEVIINKE